MKTIKRLLRKLKLVRCYDCKMFRSDNPLLCWNCGARRATTTNDLPKGK